jgi:hypothetical protein
VHGKSGGDARYNQEVSEEELLASVSNITAAFSAPNAVRKED